MADAVSGGVERIFDDPSAARAAAGPRRHERPAKTRIHLAPRLFLGHEPSDRPKVDTTERQVARPERQNGRDRDLDSTQRRLRGQSCSSKSRDERQSQSERPNRHTNRRLDQHVRMSRDEKGRQEVPIEPALIRRERAGHEDDADRCDHNLGDPTRRQLSAKPICDTRGACRGSRERRS